MNKTIQNGTKSVTVVIFKGDEVLLVKNDKGSDHPDGIYGLPAGRVETNENWEEAAKRECVEESGIIAKKLIKLPTLYEADLERKNGKTEHFCCWSFYCPEFEGSLKSSDETKPVWIKISDINKLHLVVNVDKMIEEASLFRLN